MIVLAITNNPNFGRDLPIQIRKKTFLELLMFGQDIFKLGFGLLCPAITID
jgi:hypothetical protein